MKNQYKIEVDQISLSESFKQSLKEKMAAEYAAEAANTLKTKKSFNFLFYPIFQILQYPFQSKTLDDMTSLLF